MTIYADVLVALNILLTYILLVASRVLCKVPTNKWAIMIASIIGGISSLVIFFEDGGVVFSCFYKIITGVVIVGIGFLPKTIVVFIKVFLAFFGISLLFGGGLYALEITLYPKNIFFYNGTVYFDVSIAYIIASVLVIYGIFLLGDYLITKHSHKGGKCQLEIAYNNSYVNITAFVDTGNTLTDGMTGRPVVIAELSAVSALFSRDEIQFFKSEKFEDVPVSLNKSFSLVSCQTVAGASLLKAFKPMHIKIKDGKNCFVTDFCTVALINRELSQGEYNALLNEKIFENVKEEKYNEEIYI